jgi:hypothetical protein
MPQAQAPELETALQGVTSTTVTLTLTMFCWPYLRIIITNSPGKVRLSQSSGGRRVWWAARQLAQHHHALGDHH